MLKVDNFHIKGVLETTMPNSIKTLLTVTLTTILILNLTVVKSNGNFKTTKSPFNNTTGYDDQVENVTIPTGGKYY